MISGVQILPARVRPAVTGRRTGLALILLLGAVGIPLAYSLIPGQHAVDMPASEPALAVSGQTQRGGGDVQAPVSTLTTGRVEASTRSTSPVAPATAAPESHGVGSARSFQQPRLSHTSSAAGGAISADRAAQLSSQTDTADDMAGNDSALGGAALEPLAPVAEEVLHITNVGDRIVVTRGAEGPRATAAPERSAGSSGPATDGSNGSVDGNPDSVGAAEQRPDYEDVYPGCPRVLPQGADEKMALERQQLYGCLYYATCANPEGNEPPYCTWHLIKKL